ncbi:MAG: hypothetical protein NUW37_04955 [Planctomycetes bacterium]|nr:hypothetical protein [Planctomycetota bacterium]
MKTIARYSGLASLRSWFIHRTMLEVILIALLATISFELVTCVLRFGMHLESQHDTSFLSHYTFGLRIHHGYIGALIVIVAWVALKCRGMKNIGFVFGSALLFSDLVHHFGVLWYFAGSPEFHLTYG